MESTTVMMNDFPLDGPSPDYSCTYSPEDNKIRLYMVHKLPPDLYERVKAAGFKWAGAQQLFVAPMWTPEREDLMLELCGTIEDEDKSLVERAEERAERFGAYEDHRREDAERAHTAVASITNGIPLGQPILVGHHSERHARKDAERIENGMRKAVNMWETAEYWKHRAAGAIAHAKYKEQPGVRARRIKGLEADARSHTRDKDTATRFLTYWQNVLDPDQTSIKRKDGEPTSALDRALFITNMDYISASFPLDQYPRDHSTYEGSMSLYTALSERIITAEQAQAIAIPCHERTIRRADRWLAHLANRLTYERAMLEEQGASSLLEKKPRPQQLPLCNYRQDVIRIENQYHKGEFINYPQIEMTQAEYTKIPNDYKGTRVVDHSHRVRTCMRQHRLVAVFLTDSKVHEKPPMIEPVLEEPPAPRPQPLYQAPEPTKFDALKETLQSGVQIVSAPQLFPTPDGVADKMVTIARLVDGDRILEPQIGTGKIADAIIRAAADVHIVGVEINRGLIEQLHKKYDGRRLPPQTELICEDFLLMTPERIGKFPRIIMNPPFTDGADWRHILHARTFLEEGGLIVALCANGPRQQAKLMHLATTWEPLPEGTFRDAGTNVRTVLLTIPA